MRSKAAYNAHIAPTDNFPAVEERGQDARTKSLFYAPWLFLAATTHKDKPTQMSYDLLRRMARLDIIAQAIILTRINQVAQFSRPQRSIHDMGYRIRLKTVGSEQRTMSQSEKERAHELEEMVLHTSTVEKAYKRPDFETFLRKFIKDSMTFDQAAFEIVNTRGSEPYEWYAIDAGSIRFAVHPGELEPPGDLESKRMEVGNKANAGEIEPYSWTFNAAVPMAYDKNALRSSSAFVQVFENRVITEYAEEELGFLIRNHDSNIEQNGYGIAELEILVHHVTAQLFQESYNRNFFKQGSAIKGIINVPSNVPDQMLDAFRREWHAQVSGVWNAWRTPIIRSDKLSFTNLHSSNREMEWQEYANYLIRCHGAVFSIDPYEFGFDIKTGTGPSQNAPLFETSNEAKIKWSKDRGLKPLLSSVERVMNQNIIWRIDPRFELALVRLDAKTEEATIEVRTKELQAYKTLDETRVEANLEPLGDKKGGDLIMSAPFLQYNQQKMMQQQMEEQGEGGGDQQQGDQPQKEQTPPKEEDSIYSPGMNKSLIHGRINISPWMDDEE